MKSTTIYRLEQEAGYNHPIPLTLADLFLFVQELIDDGVSDEAIVDALAQDGRLILRVSVENE